MSTYFFLLSHPSVNFTSVDEVVSEMGVGRSCIFLIFFPFGGSIRIEFRIYIEIKNESTQLFVLITDAPRGTLLGTGINFEIWLLRFDIESNIKDFRRLELPKVFGRIRTVPIQSNYTKRCTSSFYLKTTKFQIRDQELA